MRAHTLNRVSLWQAQQPAERAKLEAESKKNLAGLGYSL